MDSGIIGNYVVDRELGRGGMGVVYAAKHRVLGRPAAIKLLLANEPERVERFFNEARAAMAIDHPGIVKIYDVGVASDGRAYLAMELLAGQTLHAKLARGPLPLRVAVDHARQIATALAAAHAAGVIHRDLKPDNIFVDRDNQLKLVDFGIAKLANPMNVRTATGALIGTPAYMSPEQCEGLRELDARSDLYSLGCVLFAMLTGRPPFETGGTGGIIASQLNTQPPPLRSRCPSASPALEEIVRRLLAKSRDDRYPDARATLAALADPAVDVIAGGDAALTADAPLAPAPYGQPTAPTTSGPYGPPTSAAYAPSGQPTAPTTSGPYGPPTSAAYAPPSAPSGPYGPPTSAAHVPTVPTTSGPNVHATPPLARPPSGSYAPPLAAATTPPPERRSRAGILIALLAGCGVTAVVAVLATKSCNSAAPVVARVEADAAPVIAIAQQRDAGPETPVDLKSLVDAGVPAPPPDAAAVVKVGRKPDQPRLAGSGARVAEVPKPDDPPPRETPPRETPPRETPEAPPDAPPPEPVVEEPPPIAARIPFEPNSFSMPDGHDGTLDAIAQIAAKHPRVRILITGNAEPNETQNPQSLALGRANTVMIRLVNRRIARDRMQLASSVGTGRDVRISPLR